MVDTRKKMPETEVMCLQGIPVRDQFSVCHFSGPRVSVMVTKIAELEFGQS